MTEPYNQAIAAHYAAYRPPLHQMILARLFSDDEAFRTGLDVGCGTGYSAVALAKYCRRVYGVDPSPSMLDEAMPHERITYLEGTGEKIPLPDNSVEGVTFAGSLFYAKTPALIPALKRVCREEAWVVSYDFEILLDDVLSPYGLRLQEATSAYDHTVDFSDTDGFEEVAAGSEQIRLVVTPAQCAHLLLSDLDRYEGFVEKYGGAEPFPLLVDALGASGSQHLLKAMIYFARYRLGTV